MSSTRHLVTALGDLGADTLDTLRGGVLMTHEIDVKWHEWWGRPDDDAAVIAAHLVEGGPSVVCIGIDVPTELALDVTQCLVAIAPTLEVMLVATPTGTLWSSAARAGVREIVPPDAAPAELCSAIDAALERVDRIRDAVAKPDRGEHGQQTIVVLSPKGGSGKTMLSVHLAAALARRAPGRVALVDLDCQFGDVATTMGLEPERSLTELAVVPTLDAATMKLFLTRDQRSDVFVLPSAGRPDDADLVDEALSTRILTMMSQEFDYVVVDTAAGIDDAALAAMAQATHLVFLASMDVSSIRNLVRELEIIDHLVESRTPRHFVLNRYDSRSGLRVDDIESAVGMKIDCRIDFDAAVLTAMNQGHVLRPSDTRTNVIKAIDEFAARLMGDAPVAAPAGSSPATSGAKQKSIFKRK